MTSMSPTPRRIDPYRVLFPLGATYGVIGAGLWPLTAAGAIPYPGVLHRELMIQGFELCFVMGFLLTAMPGFTKGAPCRPFELVLATLGAVATGVVAMVGEFRAAQAAFVVSIVLLVVVLSQRLRPWSTPRPVELVFVALGLVLGLAGGLLQFHAGTPTPFASRLVSLGMVLSLVLGFGSLLVPTFAGMRAPLAIPGVAGAHERRGRVALYAAVIAVLLGAFAAEAAARAALGAWLRACAATVMLLWVWKLVRLPGKRDLPAFALWSSGWLLLIGLWMVALLPQWTLAGLHVAFIGGYSLLTLAIATRVVVAHGRHPLDDERRVLSPLAFGLLFAALVVRVGAEMAPAHATAFLAASGTLWAAAWVLWALRAGPRIVHLREVESTVSLR
jgi:uncharacterized protein involved in response to NO